MAWLLAETGDMLVAGAVVDGFLHVATVTSAGTTLGGFLASAYAAARHGQEADLLRATGQGGLVGGCVGLVVLLVDASLGANIGL